MNKNIITIVCCVCVGLGIGYFVWGKKPVHDMSHVMNDMNSSLVGKTGNEFDQAFLQEMIVHHQGAVKMAEQVLAVSVRPELQKLAQDIISAQTKEIEMMQMWQDSWK